MYIVYRVRSSEHMSSKLAANVRTYMRQSIIIQRVVMAFDMIIYKSKCTITKSQSYSFIQYET